MSQPDSIRVVVLLEGSTISGPAKNLIEFCRVLRDVKTTPRVTLSFVVFVRPSACDLRNETAPNQLIEALESTGAEVSSIYERFPFDVRVVPQLRRVVEGFNPDIIQTHFVKSHFLVRLAGVWRTRCWIAFHHGYTKDAMRTALYNQLDRWSLREPTRIITVCQAFRKQLTTLGIPQSHICLLPNSISSNWLSDSFDVRENGSTTQLDESETNPKGERIVLAVGRLSREKAFDDLVVAIHKLQVIRPKSLVRLWIVGEGPERSRIEQTARDLNMLDRVKLIGHVRDVRPYYRRADALAISSLSEGSPNVLLEAMAAGVPIAATAVGGIPEIVTHTKTALMIRPGDPDAMANALDLLLSDSKLSEELASNAQELIRRQYSPEARSRSLLSIYKQFLPQSISSPVLVD